MVLVAVVLLKLVVLVVLVVVLVLLEVVVLVELEIDKLARVLQHLQVHKETLVVVDHLVDHLPLIDMLAAAVLLREVKMVFLVITVQTVEMGLVLIGFRSLWNTWIIRILKIFRRWWCCCTTKSSICNEFWWRWWRRWRI